MEEELALEWAGVLMQAVEEDEWGALQKALEADVSALRAVQSQHIHLDFLALSRNAQNAEQQWSENK